MFKAHPRPSKAEQRGGRFSVVGELEKMALDYILEVGGDEPVGYLGVSQAGEISNYFEVPSFLKYFRGFDIHSYIILAYFI